MLQIFFQETSMIWSRLFFIEGFIERCYILHLIIEIVLKKSLLYTSSTNDFLLKVSCRVTLFLYFWCLFWFLSSWSLFFQRKHTFVLEGKKIWLHVLLDLFPKSKIEIGSKPKSPTPDLLPKNWGNPKPCKI